MNQMRIKKMSDSSNSLSHAQGWQVVYIANSQPEAYIIIGRLKNAGIKAWVHQEPIATAYGFTTGTLGEVRVLVNPDDYDEAAAILDEDADLIDDDDLDLYEEDDNYDDDDDAEDEEDDDYDDDDDFDQ